jgi:predicted amidophosphoribosyltransferase
MSNRSRFSRLENTQQVFTLVDPEVFINKHVLLVDDAVTTGYALKACGTELLKVKDLKMSIAATVCAQ